MPAACVGFARVSALAVVAALALARPDAASAQEMDVPVALQAALMTRVITFDRNAPAPGMAVRVAVVYQAGNRASVTAAEGIERALRGVSAGDRAVHVVRIDLDKRTLSDALAEERPFAAYLTPVRAVEVEHIVKCLRDAQVRSFSGVAAYVRQGIAVGMRAEGDRPRLLINLAASRAEGAEYQAALLRLAEVVQ